MVFPGQGSQSVGMMEPYASLPAVRATFDEASEILREDMWAMVAQGPAEILGKTVNTQVIMLTAGIALLRAWREAGGAEPAAVAGHSLGEYTALVAAGVIEFRESLPLVRARAQAMQDAVPEGTGGIAAILGLEDEAIRGVCKDAAQGEVLEAANYNAPGQVVIAGNRSAVERGMALAKERGAKRAVMLPMSAPSHCSLMTPSAKTIGERLAQANLRAPQLTFINNVDVATPGEPDAIRDSLIRQLSSPVRWVEIIQSMAARGVTRIIECGPGSVLSSLNKRIASTVEAISIKDAAQLRDLAQQSRQ